MSLNLATAARRMALQKKFETSTAIRVSPNCDHAERSHSHRGFRGCVKLEVRRITLKAFANSGPGLRFGNPGKEAFIFRRRNSERAASPFANRKTAQLFRVAKNLLERLAPRVSKQTLPPHAGCSRGDPGLGWNSRTLSALFVKPKFSRSL